MGVVASFLSESFPPKSRFSVDDIPDLSGQVAIVTGANSGVGKETAKALLSRGAKVYFACRSKDKAMGAIDELREETGRVGLFLELDLSDLRSVERAASDFQRREGSLNMLFNNAGVWTPPIESRTTQGYDFQFGTNVLGHFYFTKLLLPALLLAAKRSPNAKARVIHTSSLVSMFVSTLDFRTFTDTPQRNALSTEDLYSQSKLGNIIVSNELARRYGDHGLISVAVNPGNLGQSQEHKRDDSNWLKTFIFTSLFSNPMSQGALTQLWAGTTEEGLYMNGKYLIPWARYGEPNPLSMDEKLGEALWAWLEEQVTQESVVG